jgi:hypothetical protein
VVERRSEEQVLRLEALPRSLPLGSQSCLFASAAPTPSRDGTVLVFGPDRAVCDGLGYRRIQAAMLRVGVRCAALARSARSVR